MKSLAFYDGKIVDRDQPIVCMEDRGYQFGDGVYDAWMVFNATPGGEVKRGWWKAALDHHGRKGRLLILLMRLRDRLRRVFG